MPGSCPREFSNAVYRDGGGLGCIPRTNGPPQDGFDCREPSPSRHALIMVEKRGRRFRNRCVCVLNESWTRAGFEALERLYRLTKCTEVSRTFPER
jgi:hypothetical protein